MIAAEQLMVWTVPKWGRIAIFTDFGYNVGHILSSSVVERPAVNRLVVGSNPT